MDWSPQIVDSLEWSNALKLILASVLGGLVGLEREIHGRPAGFRTHLLVAVGACLMMIVSESFLPKYAGMSSEASVRLDPGRVAAQIVTGIGFLGAGAIIKDGSAVRGLTTAACLWIVAGIGMAVGGGLYLPALLVTAISLISLWLLRRVERYVKKERYRRLTVVSDDLVGGRVKIEEFLRSRDIEVVEFGLEHDPESGYVKYEFTLSHFGGKISGTVAEDITGIGGVKRVRLH